MYDKCIFLLVSKEITRSKQMNQQDQQQKENKSSFTVTINQNTPGMRIFQSALVCIDREKKRSFSHIVNKKKNVLFFNTGIHIW